MKKYVSLLGLCVLITISCGDSASEELPGRVNLRFNNSVNGATVNLNTETYLNNSGESYQISELKYIISNIVLITTADEEVRYPIAESYFLINAEDSSSLTIALQDIPAGNYKAIQFGFGIDQQNYPLNGMANFVPKAEETGMLWNWAAGYKFVKFEGSFTSATFQNQTPFTIHVGSHGSTLDNYKEVRLDLNSEMTVSESQAGNIAIQADVAAIFDNVNTHSLSAKSDIQVDPVNAPKIAENIAHMFSIE